VIARDQCSYERTDFVFDPLHSLALLEQKVVLLIRGTAGRLGVYRRNSPCCSA
jgi:hypothetical protein